MSEFIQNIRNSLVQEGIQKASIVTKRLKVSNKCERSDSLYETVIQKNFQTINQLLRKLNTIISKHQEFQYQMLNYTKRLSKIEADMESIHNQHRRDNLHIFSNIQDLKYELNGIDNHIKMIYDNYKKKGISALTKSRQNSPRVLEGSQKCQSEQEITGQPILSKGILYNLGTSVQTNNSNLRVNQENMKKDCKNQNKNSQEHQNQQGNINSNSKINQNFNYSHKQTSQNHLKRKITSQKKHQLRQSLQQKYKVIKEGKNHIQKRSRNQNQFHSESNNRQLTSDQNITPKQTQISWNLQRFLSAMSTGNQQKSDKQKEIMRHSLLSNQRADSKIILNYISQNFKNNKQSGFKNTLSSEQLQQLIKICLHDEKIKDIEKRIGQIYLKDLQTEKQIYNLTEKQKQISQKCTLYVTNSKLSEDIYGMSKDLNKLRNYCHENFANRNQTKKALTFLENKIKNFQIVSQTQSIPNQTSVIVSKCLGCNRTANFSHETTLKSSFWAASCNENSQQKKLGIKQIRKKTFQIGKTQKPRPFSKYQRTNAI